MRGETRLTLGGLALLIGLLAGCGGKPERMQGKQAGPDSGDTKVKVKDKAKEFSAGR